MINSIVDLVVVKELRKVFWNHQIPLVGVANISVVTMGNKGTVEETYLIFLIC
jgi:hypothetical protein